MFIARVKGACLSTVLWQRVVNQACESSNARHIGSFDPRERMSRNCLTKCQSCMMNAFMGIMNPKDSTGKIIFSTNFGRNSSFLKRIRNTWIIRKVKRYGNNFYFCESNFLIRSNSSCNFQQLPDKSHLSHQLDYVSSLSLFINKIKSGQ